MKRKHFTPTKTVFLIYAASLIFMAPCLFATNVGTIGQVYPIQEMDFLDFIQSRALSMQQNGMLNKLQQDMKAHAESYRDRPTPVAEMSHTAEQKSWAYDPSIVLDHDVVTPEGKLIGLQGTRINPLVYASLSKTLIFYDADDKKQMEWVLNMDKKLKGKDKIILVKGSILAEESRLKKEIYFDQGGHLTTKFGITHVPSIVYQVGLGLRVSEVLP